MEDFMKLKDVMDKDVLSFFGKYAKKVGEIDGDDLNQESIMKAIAGGDTE